jgi:hypothetical protein
MLVAAHATHGDVGVDASGSTPPALLLAMAAQVHGMPVPVGGAVRLAEAMVAAARRRAWSCAPASSHPRRRARRPAVGVVTADGTGIAARRAVVADVAPTLLARDLVGEQHLPGDWLASLRRTARTSGYFRPRRRPRRPAPWADERLLDSAVVHVTGDLDELAMSQAQVRRGRLPELPQLIVGQQDRADPTRVPPGAASLWVECHCPARPVGEDGDWAPAFAERCSTGSRRTPRPARAGRRHDRPAAAGAAGARPQPRRRRRRRRVRLARPAARLPAVAGLVAVRAAGARAVDVRRGVAPGRRVHGCAAQRGRAVLRTRAAQALGCVRIVASSKCIGSVYFQSPPQAKPHRLKISTTGGPSCPRCRGSWWRRPCRWRCPTCAGRSSRWGCAR